MNRKDGRISIFLDIALFLFRNFVCSPPPSYQEVYAAERDQPPTYEDVVKQDTDTHNVQIQDDQENQIENEENEHPDDQPMSDNLEQENQEVDTNIEESENPIVEDNQ